MKNRLHLLFVITICWSCNTHVAEPEFSSRDVTKVLQQMTDLMVHDVTNPPLAARFFSYACLAGYEVVSQNAPGVKKMHGLLNNYPEIKKPDSISGFNYPISALLAMMETAKKMQPSGRLMDQYETAFLDSLELAGVPEETLEQSRLYAQFISRQILAYAKADGYNKISNFLRYSPLESEGSWYPTPPAYELCVKA